MQACPPPSVQYSLSGYVYVLSLNASDTHIIYLAPHMFIPYLTLQATSVGFLQPSHFCSLYMTFFSPLAEPQFGANHMILPLPRATYPVAIQHAVHPHISHCSTDNSSGVLGGDGLCEHARGYLFSRNVGHHSPSDTVSQPRRRQSSITPQEELPHSYRTTNANLVCVI